MTLTRSDAPGRRDGSDRARPDAADGVESNGRLTASTAVVLLVLLAVEGVTILQIRPLLAPHVFIGMVLIPPVLVKIGSTTYRFVRYYRYDPRYRRKGPPPALLRLFGPLVVVSTVVLLASGVALVATGPAWRHRLLLLHKASFILWFGAMTVHVLGHVTDTARMAPRDWVRRTRGDVAGAGARQWTIVVSLVVGILLGILMVGRAATWLAAGPTFRAGTHHRVPFVVPTLPAGPTTNGSRPSPTTAAPSKSLTTPFGRASPVPLGGSSPTTVPTGSTSVPPVQSSGPAKSHRHHHVGRKSKR